MGGIYGADSDALSADLSNLGACYQWTKQDQAAEQAFLRALAIDEKSLPPDSPDLASDRHNLGVLYVFTKRYQQAVPLFQKALDVRMKAFGPRNVETQSTLTNYALALRNAGQTNEAYKIEKRIAAQ